MFNESKKFLLLHSLATSTTYANYREQMEQNASVQIEKKTVHTDFIFTALKEIFI